jgi:phosphoenolpyruvate---glycerone phosphotransferase subunit DhaL
MSNHIAAITAVGQAIIKNKEYLTELDREIGDADHGINMAKGFEAVITKISSLEEDKDIGFVLKTVAMTLISSVGGASGPLYGTAFLRAAVPAAGKVELDSLTAQAMWEAAVTGIKERGKANRGEKTMLDALEPALEAFSEGIKENKTLLTCLELASTAAQEGVEYTKTIAATKGRASYLGERSIGHQDPGATSASIMISALLEFCHSNRVGGA